MSTARAVGILLYGVKYLLADMPRGGIFLREAGVMRWKFAFAPLSPTLCEFGFFRDGRWGIRTNICKLAVNIA